MLIKYWMSSEVMSVDNKTSVLEVHQLMRQQNVKNLPVLSDDELIGIVTYKDIIEVYPSKATVLDLQELYYLLSELTVDDIMTTEVITCYADNTVEEAAMAMENHKVSCFPVISDGKMVGIFTKSDLLRAIVSMTGVNRKGIQFGFNLPDTPGSIKEITDVIRRFGVKMISILTSYTTAKDGRRHVFIRIDNVEEEKLKQLTDEFKQKFKRFFVNSGEHPLV